MKLSIKKECSLPKATIHLEQLKIPAIVEEWCGDKPSSQHNNDLHNEGITNDFYSGVDAKLPWPSGD